MQRGVYRQYKEVSKLFFSLVPRKLKNNYRKMHGLVKKHNQVKWLHKG